MLVNNLTTVATPMIRNLFSLKEPSWSPQFEKEKRQRPISRSTKRVAEPPPLSLEEQSQQKNRRTALNLVGATLSCYLYHSRDVLADVSGVEDSKIDGSERTSIPERKLQIYVGDRFSLLVPKDFINENIRLKESLAGGGVVLKPGTTKPTLLHWTVLVKQGRLAEYFYFIGSFRFENPTELVAPADSDGLGMYNNNKQMLRTPFEARFESEDRQESISVIEKPSSSLKLTFFSVQDIQSLGSLEECQQLFVPPGVRILRTTVDRTVDARTRYTYEFETKKIHVMLSAIVNRGEVYVTAATASRKRWDTAKDYLTESVYSFRLG